MATTIGTEYDHIDITNGVSTIRHPLKDASARENLVKVQDTQPQSNDNVLWIKETPEAETQVPTYAEFQEVSGDVSNLKSAIHNKVLWSDTALFILDAIGNSIAFTSADGGTLWNNLISELQNPTVTERYTIAMNGDNFVSSNPMAYAIEGRGYETVISPKVAYNITALTVAMGETSITPTDNGDGTYTISIPSANANISIAVTTTLDPNYVLYHIDNLVCDGTQEPIETPLQFSSVSANGVVDAWTLCAKATGASNVGAYCFVFSTPENATRISWDTYTAFDSQASSAASRARVCGMGETTQLQTLKNSQSSVVITHEAGSANSLTVHYIDRTTGEYTKTTYSGSGVNTLSYANGATPLRIGTNSTGDGKFVGNINDVTIYKFVMNESDIRSYLEGGVTSNV